MDLQAICIKSEPPIIENCTYRIGKGNMSCLDWDSRDVFIPRWFPSLYCVHTADSHRCGEVCMPRKDSCTVGAHCPMACGTWSITGTNSSYSNMLPVWKTVTSGYKLWLSFYTFYTLWKPMACGSPEGCLAERAQDFWVQSNWRSRRTDLVSVALCRMYLFTQWLASPVGGSKWERKCLGRSR